MAPAPVLMVEAIRQGDIPGVQIRLRRRLDASPEEAWAWVAPSRLWPRWLCSSVRESEAAGLELDEALPEGETFRERLTLAGLGHGRWVGGLRREGAGWGADTRLTVEILAAGEGSELSVFHEEFQRLPLSIGLSEWEAYRRRWRHAAERLATGVTGQA